MSIVRPCGGGRARVVECVQVQVFSRLNYIYQTYSELVTRSTQFIVWLGNRPSTYPTQRNAPLHVNSIHSHLPVNNAAFPPPLKHSLLVFCPVQQEH